MGTMQPGGRRIARGRAFVSADRADFLEGDFWPDAGPGFARRPELFFGRSNRTPLQHNAGVTQRSRQPEVGTCWSGLVSN
jgi:hypothetical protein